jgi:hypothetical protein
VTPDRNAGVKRFLADLTAPTQGARTVKAADLIATLGRKTRAVAAVTVITKADCERIAEQARQMKPVPRDVPGWGENPRFPWEPDTWRSFDCADLDRGRIS